MQCIANNLNILKKEERKQINLQSFSNTHQKYFKQIHLSLTHQNYPKNLNQVPSTRLIEVATEKIETSLPTS